MSVGLGCKLVLEALPRRTTERTSDGDPQSLCRDLVLARLLHFGVHSLALVELFLRQRHLSILTQRRIRAP